MTCNTMESGALMSGMQQRWIREPVNGLTHFVGAVLAAFGWGALVVASEGEAVRVVSFSVYGASLVLLLGASAAYHSAWVKGGASELLRKVDHLSISLLVAGTYTPICLLALPSAWGWSIFGVIWGLAAIAAFVAIRWVDAPRWIPATLFTVMGWTIIVAIGTVYEHMSAAGFTLLVTGGGVYSLGALIYARKWPDPWPAHFGFHGIWHLFVLGGAGCHYAMMWSL